MEYTDLEVWKGARILGNSIYKTSNSFPRNETYGLKNQIGRGAVSIPSNIAEGYWRWISADTVKLLPRARGTLYELETQLKIALDQGYIEERKFKMVSDRVVLCKKLLNGFIKYFKKR